MNAPSQSNDSLHSRVEDNHRPESEELLACQPISLSQTQRQVKHMIDPLTTSEDRHRRKFKNTGYANFFTQIAVGLRELGKNSDITPTSPGAKGPERVSKVLDTDFVTPDVLEEAYRQARVRLQMCQGNLLVKFNDDDRRIFAELRAQLQETYEKIKSSSSCQA